MRHLKTYENYYEDADDSVEEHVQSIKDILLEFDSTHRYKEFDQHSDVMSTSDGSIYVKIGYNDPYGYLTGEIDYPILNSVYPFLKRIISYMGSNGYRYHLVVGELNNSMSYLSFGFSYPYSCFELCFE